MDHPTRSSGRAASRATSRRGAAVRAAPARPIGQHGRPSACPVGPCRRPRAVRASAYPEVFRSEGAPHAATTCRPASTWRRSSRFPADRGRRHRRRRVRRPRRAGAGQRADARHELDPVHPDVRRLHRGLVPRPRRLRLLPQRRRRVPTSCAIGADGAMPTATGRARPAPRTRTAPTYRVSALEAGPGRQRHHGRGRGRRPSPPRTRFKLIVNQGGRPTRRSTTSRPSKGKNNVVTRSRRSRS